MNLVIVEAYLIFISKPCYCIKEIYWIGLKALDSSSSGIPLAIFTKFTSHVIEKHV